MFWRLFLISKIWNFSESSCCVLLLRFVCMSVFYYFYLHKRENLDKMLEKNPRTHSSAERRGPSSSNTHFLESCQSSEDGSKKYSTWFLKLSSSFRAVRSIVTWGTCLCYVLKDQTAYCNNIFPCDCNCQCIWVQQQHRKKVEAEKKYNLIF